MDFKENLLAESEHWGVYLHNNQYYLGRSYIWARRGDARDLLDITDSERDDFFNISRTIKKALSQLFNPDLFNYASLGNISSHLHVHVIPRYKKPREFSGQIFIDGNWGHNYAPYDYNFEIPEDTLFRIRDAMIEKIK